MPKPALEFPTPSPLGVPVADGLELVEEDELEDVEVDDDDSGWRKLIPRVPPAGDEDVIELD